MLSYSWCPYKLISAFYTHLFFLLSNSPLIEVRSLWLCNFVRVSESLREISFKRLKSKCEKFSILYALFIKIFRTTNWYFRNIWNYVKHWNFLGFNNSSCSLTGIFIHRYILQILIWIKNILDYTFIRFFTIYSGKFTEHLL